MPAISEQEWQDQVLDLAHLYGWLIHHCRPAQNRSGRWSTPIQGDPGFPDLVLARGGRVVFAELKNQQGRLNINQTVWQNAIAGTWLQGAEWYCWRPADLALVQRALEWPKSKLKLANTIPTTRNRL